ncbi:MAG: threonine synthase, partial [Ktedonobacterales bacterium]|nr:threonine synthase [Ktedonobacterales bacterium]
MPTYLTHLECAECGSPHSAEREQHLCACGGVLLARYDLARLAHELPRATVTARPWNAG